VQWVRLDFEELYRLGHIDVRACDLLQRILDTYNIKYELLANSSPDVGVEYLTDDVEFINAFEKAEYPSEIDKVIEEYATKKGAEAVVELFDGYEIAWAVVYPSEE
jgi:crotonobetainyl-CoA:carnitine CoA-transferase CaiB-like acyl-CoA transferase